MDEPGYQECGRGEQEGGEEAIEEIPAEIDRPAPLEQSARTDGEHVFERREHHGDHSEQQARPQHVAREPKHMLMRRQKLSHEIMSSRCDGDPVL
jgi:sarcosine oxidase delta subunit